MSETRLEERLRTEMAAAAGRVRTSPDAWLRIQDRAEGGRGGRRWALLALAAATATAGVVAATVLPRPGGLTIGPDPAGTATVASPPARTEPPPATEAPTPASPTPASPSPVDPAGAAERTAPALAWSAVPLDTAGLASPSAEGIARVGDVVVVVGETADARQVTWRSEDGGRTFGTPVVGAHGAWFDAATVGDRIVVVGEEGGVPAVDVLDPATGDRRAVHRGGAPGRLYAVTDGPAGPVATGNAASSGRSGLILAGDPTADVWAPVAASGMEGSETVLYHVVGGRRGYVATGYGPDAATLVDLWHSPDGRTWEHLARHPATGIATDEGVLDGLTVDPSTGRFWAVQAGGTVWVSDDGRRWSRTAELDAGPGRTPGFRSPAAVGTPEGLLAVAGEDRMTAYWTSSAGGVAVPLDDVQARSLTVGAGIARSDDGVVTVPLEGPDGLFVWRGEPVG